MMGKQKLKHIGPAINFVFHSLILKNQTPICQKNKDKSW